MTTAEAAESSAPRVFLSYAWEDDAYRALVKQLAVRLRQDGVDARLDAWHAQGVSIPEFMSREVRRADKVLVLCSPMYQQKVHAMEDGLPPTGVGWEAMVVTSALWDGRLRREQVEVALLRGSWRDAAPQFLSGTPHTDLSDPASFERQYRDLLRHLADHREAAPPLGQLPADIDPEPVEPLRGTPSHVAPARQRGSAGTAEDSEPREPAGFSEDSDPRAAQRRGSAGFAEEGGPSVAARLPPIWNIAEERNAHFTGRDEMLAALHQALCSGETAALTQAISGLGGVGKTTLALEYAYRYAGEYEGIWWIHAEEPATLARDYAELGPALGLPDRADQRQLVREVRQAVSQRQGLLLVFDNAADPEVIRPYLPLGPRRRVVVTTRAAVWPNANVQEVQELSLEAAVQFLQERTEQTDLEAAGAIATQLGCLPLALEQAAAYVEACRTTLPSYARLLEEHGLKLLEQGDVHQYPASVGTTWNLAFEQVRSCCPVAADLLCLCAYLAPEAIHLPELAGAAQRLPSRLGAAVVDELARNEARAALLRFSLIRAEGPVISVHRLVQRVTRERLTEPQRDEWQGAALRTVAELFPDDSHDVRNWSGASRWLAHALTVTSGRRAEELDAQASGALLNKVAMHFYSRANYSEAEPLCRRALSIGEASPGPDHPQVAVRLNNLALLLKVTNRLGEAELLYRRALSVAEASYGADHPEVATDLNNLANLLQVTNRLGEAELLYRRALSIDEASYGVDHPEVATDLNNLAVLLHAAGRLDEAEPLCRRALSIDEVSCGPDHPDVARDLNNLAALLHATGRLDEAEPLYRRALSIDETSLGPDHPEVATRLNNLAKLLQATNRLSEAESLYRRALSIGEASLGPGHPKVATRLNNLAKLLQATNRPREAEPLLRRAVNVLEASLGPDHPRTAEVLDNLRALLQQLA